LQSHEQPLKQERGFSAVRSDIGDASPDLLHQFYGLIIIIIIIIILFVFNVSRVLVLRDDTVNPNFPFCSLNDLLLQA